MTARRGFSLIEITVALGILAAMLIPLFNGPGPRAVAVTPRLSSASHLLRDVLDTASRMPRRKLYEMIAGAPESEAGFHLIDLRALGVGLDHRANPLLPAGLRVMGSIEDLEAKLWIRVVPNVMGAFGLDRLDYVLGFSDHARQQYIVRSTVRRNVPDLMALGALRAAAAGEPLTEEDFKTGLRELRLSSANIAVAYRKRGNPFLVPTYPQALKRFDPPPADAGDALARFDQLIEYAQGADVEVGEAPEFPGAAEPRMPRFAARMGICQ